MLAILGELAFLIQRYRGIQVSSRFARFFYNANLRAINMTGHVGTLDTWQLSYIFKLFNFASHLLQVA
jgi:hypothetical protein